MFKNALARIRDGRSKALLIAGAAVLAIGASAGTASALPNCTPGCDFTINPNSLVGVVPGIGSTFSDPTLNPTPNSVIGQDITGNYSEHLTLNANGTWSAFGYIQFSSILAGTGNDGTAYQVGSAIASSVSGLNSLGNGYFLYSEFTATGTWAFSAPSIILNVGTFGNNGLNVDGISAGQTNTYNSAAATITHVGTDVQLLTAAFVSGAGNSTLGPNASGSFDVTLKPTLTSPTGENYFTAPRPFHIVLDLSGQFIPSTFDPTFGGGLLTSQTFTFQNISADMTMASTVPEPATLSLLGLGLVGLARQRRKKKA